MNCLLELRETQTQESSEQGDRDWRYCFGV